MSKISSIYFPVFGILLALMLIMGGEVKGQTRTYLKGQKTGNIVQDAFLIGLGPGSAGLSSPMNTHAWSCLLGIQTSEFRYYYGDETILTNTTTNNTKITASRTLGLLGALGSGADAYLQIRNTSNALIPGFTPTYIKLKERPTNSGISLNIGGLLGLAELNSITGNGYNALNYKLNTAHLGFLSCPEAYNGDENGGTLAGTKAGTITKLLIDATGDWYAKVTPDAAYNSIRLNVEFPSGVTVASLGSEVSVNVYNAFTQVPSTCSGRAQFTNAGEATGIVLNTGVLGLNLNQLVINPQNAINGDPTKYSSFSAGILNLGVASTISQTFYFDHSGVSNDGVSFRMGLPQSLINLSLFGNGITFKVYNDETLVNTQTLSTNILDLNLLNLISLGPGYKELNVTINPNTTFNKVVVELNAGLLNLGIAGDQLRLYDVTLTAAKPTFTNPNNSQNVKICSGNTTILSATTSSGNELIWYDSLTGTTPLVGNPDGTYTTPVLINDAIYYVASRRIGCTYESERVPININVIPIPITPSGTAAPVCASSNGIFNVTNPITGYIYNWYKDANGGSPIMTGTIVTTPTPLTMNTTYFLEAVNGTCVSPTRAEVTITVNSLPQVSATSPSPIKLCVNTGLTCENLSQDPGIWTVDNSAIATITSTGIIWGVSEGSTSVTYKVTNSNGCSNSITTTVIVSSPPTISLNSIPEICVNSADATLLSYTMTTGTHLKYSINWDNSDLPSVNNLDLPTSPINITVPTNTPAGSYRGTFSLRDDVSNCNRSYIITVKINPRIPKPIVSLQ